MGQFVNKLYPFICNIDDQKDHRFFFFLKGISKTNRQDEVATKGLWAWKHYIGANQRQIKRERESEKRYVHG